MYTVHWDRGPCFHGSMDHWNLDPILNFRRLALEASLNIPGRPYCWWKKSPQQLEAAKSFQGSLMGKINSTLEFTIWKSCKGCFQKDSGKHSSSLPSIVEPRFPVPPSIFLGVSGRWNTFLKTRDRSSSKFLRPGENQWHPAPCRK